MAPNPVWFENSSTTWPSGKMGKYFSEAMFDVGLPNFTDQTSATDQREY